VMCFREPTPDELARVVVPQNAWTRGLIMVLSLVTVAGIAFLLYAFYAMEFGG
jgi:hypothetical protein